MKQRILQLLLLTIALTMSLNLISWGYRDDKGEDKPATPTKESTPAQEVDLGLSVKWASWNVGASSPEQYGGYYAWGEIEEKRNYDLDTYKYYNSGTNDYIDISNNISGTQYDVATVKWRNGWRMPTSAELTELNTKCKWEVYTYNGVKGCKVTGPNGNFIFLPFAGYFNGASLRHNDSSVYYWSGSLSDGISIKLFSDVITVGPISVFNDDNRHNGYSVRPVRN